MNSSFILFVILCILWVFILLRIWTGVLFMVWGRFCLRHFCAKLSLVLVMCILSIDLVLCSCSSLFSFIEKVFSQLLRLFCNKCLSFTSILTSPLCSTLASPLPAHWQVLYQHIGKSFTSTLASPLCSTLASPLPAHWQVLYQHIGKSFTSTLVNPLCSTLASPLPAHWQVLYQHIGKSLCSTLTSPYAAYWQVLYAAHWQVLYAAHW